MSTRSQWRAQQLAAFDPEAPSQAARGLFGLPFTAESAELVILPVPWEVTTSFREGTARAPAAIRAASPQIDYFDPLLPDIWQLGVAEGTLPEAVSKANAKLRPLARERIARLETGQAVDTETLEEINAGCTAMVESVREQAQQHLAENQRVAVLGGDHSTPLGLLQALDAQGEAFGILHLDAHADLRADYEGFTHSHAAIMHHAAQLRRVETILQVGLRDFSQAEWQRATDDPRIVPVPAAELNRTRFNGTPWGRVCEDLVDKLPERVYVTLDADVLEPSLVPNTGTPVPGGLTYAEVLHLLEVLHQRGRRMIGFDLVELAPSSEAEAPGTDILTGVHLLWALARFCLAAKA